LPLDSHYLPGEIYGVLLPVTWWQSGSRAAALRIAESLSSHGSEAEERKPVRINLQITFCVIIR